MAGPPGATSSIGPRVHSGTHQALWSVQQLQDLLDEWITACWQTRSHEDLRHPAISGAALSPNEMWGALVAWCGYVPLPLTGADYPELLPVRWQAVTERGIRIGHRTYDAPCLDAHRGQPSPVASRSGKWEIHTHPHDLRQIWIRLPDGQLHEVPWIHRDHVRRPFDDAVRRQAVQAVEQRAARAQHQADLADVTGQLLTRARTGPAAGAVALAGAGPVAERPARATAAGHARRPDGVGDDEVRSTDTGRTAPAQWAADDDSLDALDSGGVDGQPGPGRGAFAVYDADLEAEQW